MSVYKEEAVYNGRGNIIVVTHQETGEYYFKKLLKDYVHVMTPYLILDGELNAALKVAVQRGEDVKLILPGIPDNILAHALAKSHYKELTDAGVQIFEYTPGFVHAKVWVSDSIRAVVGTINLDYRKDQVIFYAKKADNSK